MKNIRKLEGGVVYHHHHEQSRTAGSPRTAANSVTHSPSIAQRTSSAMSPSPSTSSVNSATSRPPQSTDPLSSSTGPTPNSRDLGSMAQKAQKRTVRSMASSVVVEGDRRQRVDVSLGLILIFEMSRTDSTCDDRREWQHRSWRTVSNPSMILSLGFV